jgi:hypothetical protein
VQEHLKRLKQAGYLICERHGRYGTEYRPTLPGGYHKVQDSALIDGLEVQHPAPHDPDKVQNPVLISARSCAVEPLLSSAPTSSTPEDTNVIKTVHVRKTMPESDIETDIVQASLVPLPTIQKTNASQRTPTTKSSKKPKVDTDPRVRNLIAYFCEQYVWTYHAKYTVAGGKDGQAVKALLQDHSTETLQRCIDAFFADNDPWLNGKRTIGVFRSRVNQYVQQCATPRQPRPSAPSSGPQYRDLSNYQFE